MKDHTKTFDAAAAPRFADKPRPVPAMHHATLDTRNFSFEAFAAGRDEAWGVLIMGLHRHADAYKLPHDWFGEYLGDIQVRAVEMGVAYRDREPIK